MSPVDHALSPHLAPHLGNVLCGELVCPGQLIGANMHEHTHVTAIGTALHGMPLLLRVEAVGVDARSDSARRTLADHQVRCYAAWA